MKGEKKLFFDLLALLTNIQLKSGKKAWSLYKDNINEENFSNDFTH